MSIVHALILGAVQGLTEFLPISSSGHLVIVSALLSGLTAPLFFDVAVHAGSLAALVLYFRREVIALLRGALALVRWRPGRRLDGEARLTGAVLIATAPAAVTGFALGDAIERAFGSPATAVNLLLMTAFVLLAGESLAARRRGPRATVPGPLVALLVGLAQTLALFPGVSRSGSTIATGMALGLEREAAMRFAFLMAIPALAGAFLVSALDATAASADLPAAVAGFGASFVVSLFAIVFMLDFFRKRPLTVFAGYCVLLSVAGRFVV